MTPEICFYVVVVQNETSILLQYSMIVSEMISVCSDAKPEKNSLEIWIFQINTIDLIAILPKFKLNSIYSKVHKIIEFIGFHFIHCKFINSFNAI